MSWLHWCLIYPLAAIGAATVVGFCWLLTEPGHPHDDDGWGMKR